MPESVAILLWNFMVFVSVSAIVCGGALWACHLWLTKVGRSRPVRRAPDKIAGPSGGERPGVSADARSNARVHTR